MEFLIGFYRVLQGFVGVSRVWLGCCFFLLFARVFCVVLG